MISEKFYNSINPEQACELLDLHGRKARILAGGTDLMVAVNQGALSLEKVIYIGNSGLNYIREEGEDLVIGAAATHSAISQSTIVREKAPLLAKAVKSIGSPAIRNMGSRGSALACPQTGLV